jgi:hypothetical protein
MRRLFGLAVLSVAVMLGIHLWSSGTGMVSVASVASAASAADWGAVGASPAVTSTAALTGTPSSGGLSTWVDVSGTFTVTYPSDWPIRKQGPGVVSFDLGSTPTQTRAIELSLRQTVTDSEQTAADLLDNAARDVEFFWGSDNGNEVQRGAAGAWAGQAKAQYADLKLTSAGQSIQLRLIVARVAPGNYAVVWVFWPSPLTAQEEQAADRLLTSIRVGQGASR